MPHRRFVPPQLPTSHPIQQSEVGSADFLPVELQVELFGVVSQLGQPAPVRVQGTDALSEVVNVARREELYHRIADVRCECRQGK